MIRKKTLKLDFIYFIALVVSLFAPACDNDKNQFIPLQNSFYKTFGGAGEDYGFGLDQTSDGGYILTGFTTSYGAGSWDAWLVRTDSLGNGLWHRTFGGLQRDSGFDVKITHDGGFIVVGESGSFESNGQIYIIKTDSNGNEEWFTTLGGSQADGARFIMETSDSNYVVVGYTYSYGEFEGRDMWIIKLDQHGNIIWNKTHGWAYSEMGAMVAEALGGYFVVGTKYNHILGNNNLWLVMLDTDGNELWDFEYGFNVDAYGQSITRTSDGQYVLAGITDSLKNDWYDLWIMKFDFSANFMWAHIYPFNNNPLNNWSYVDVDATMDGGVIVVGPTTKLGGGQEALLMKISSDGDLEWSQAYGATGSELGINVIQDRDGGYTFIGRTNTTGNGLYDFLLVKTDENGALDRLPD